MCKIPCVDLFIIVFFFKWQVKMLTCWQSQSKSGLQAWWGQQKISLLPCHSFSSLPPSPLPLSTLSSLSHSAFFPSSAHMKCIYLGLGRETVTGWNKCLDKCSVPCQERRSSRDVCVCVWRVWLLKPKICRLRRFDRSKVNATTLELILN